MTTDNMETEHAKIRPTLISEMIKELRGPRFGAEEILSDNPLDEYITGVVVPFKKEKDNEDPENFADDDFSDKASVSQYTSDVSGGFEDDSDDSENQFVIPNTLDPTARISSFGLSFFIRKSCSRIKLCVSWSRYKQNMEGSDKKWVRIPNYKILSINPQECKDPVIVSASPDEYIRLWIKKYDVENQNQTQIVMSLVNELEFYGKSNEEKAVVALFQPSIRVVLDEDDLQPKYLKPHTDMEYISMDDAPLARGYMCGAVWKKIDYNHQVPADILWPEYSCVAKESQKEADEFLHCQLRTEFLPLSAIPMPKLEWEEDVSNPEMSLYRLSEAWDTETLEKYLRPWTSLYSEWIEKNNTATESDPDLEHIRKRIIGKERQVLDRLNKGIKCLLSNEDARLAFCFANRVILQQRIWKDKKICEKPEIFKWRPFQMAFFLNSVESLYNPKSNDREVLDLLWIPTGGGKTEAYLFMMAFVMALRRIRKTDDAHASSGAGVSIITRYTLRLLTVQQFRRTLQMVIAAEYLRVSVTNGKHGWRPASCPDETDWLYGKIRYSIGMLVGGGVTPNTLRRDKDGAIPILEDGVDKVQSEPAQLVKCPVCGEWLSIPKSEESNQDGGLPAGNYTFHLIIETEMPADKLREELSKQVVLKDVRIQADLLDDVFSPDVPSTLQTLKISWTSKTTNVEKQKYDDLIEHHLLKNIPHERISFSPSYPGYFPKKDIVGMKPKTVDFDIFCPNPECPLNTGHQWYEENPFETDVSLNPLYLNHGIPIPAYTVDEQVYHRCPTVIVCTADKIARFAYEPRAGALFGDVRIYNRIYGYLRGLLPESKKDAKSPYYPAGVKHGDLSNTDDYVEVKPFLPPDMIVQDELHLLEGSLGSMFGIYELMIRALISSSGGNPKYIASSATVTNAEIQIKQLFNCNTLQFPPYGLKANDSFFVHLSEAAWDDDKPGRVYMGILGPGRGSLTPLIRIWSRLLKTVDDYRNRYGDEPDNHVNNFWTVVGYCNAIRELGGLGALYHEDIKERLLNISKPAKPRDIITESTGRFEELSSRKSSIMIPQILEQLEGEGNNTDNPTRSHDAILTTSMFGTGVDIPHLSLMVVNGQPKTTAQYIQATGRVGREVGAFIPVLFKPGRPRDLSHYEMFTGYHSTLNLSVEQASVSPYSSGCLERATGPVMVAYLRNSPIMREEWYNDDGLIILSPEAETDLQTLLSVFEKVSDRIDSTGFVAANLDRYLRSAFSRWKKLGDEANKIGDPMPFVEYTVVRKAEKKVVLGDPAHPSFPSKESLRDGGSVWSVFKNAPQSLRDVEETTEFGV